MQQPRATTSKETGLDKRFLQRTATRGNRCRRIVALEKVAGTSPVGHTLRFRIDIDVSRTLVPGSSDGRAEPALVGETRSEDRQDQGRGSARCASPSERRRRGMLEDQRAEDRAQPLAHTGGYLVEGEDPALLARARTKTRSSAAFVDRGHRPRSVTSGNPTLPLIVSSVCVVIVLLFFVRIFGCRLVLSGSWQLRRVLAAHEDRYRARVAFADPLFDLLLGGSSEAVEVPRQIRHKRVGLVPDSVFHNVLHSRSSSLPLSQLTAFFRSVRLTFSVGLCRNSP